MTFEVVERTVPSGATDRTLYVSGGSSSRTDAIRIRSLPYPPGYKMTFSMWCCTDGADTEIIIRALGQPFAMPVNGLWKRCEYVINAPVGTDILITPTDATGFYLYKAQLELGEAASDWVPSPEEFNVGSVIAMNEQAIYMGTNIFEIDIANGAELLHIDENGVVTGNMTVKEKLIAPNMAEKYTGPLTVTLGTSSGTGRQTVTPGHFSPWYTGHVLQGDGGSGVVVNEVPNWDMYRYAFTERSTVLLKSLVQGEAQGVLIMAYELNSTYYPLTEANIDTSFDADALLINVMRTERIVDSEAQQHTAYPATHFSQRLMEGRAMMTDNGVLCFQEAENWDVFRLPFTGKQSLRIDEINKNTALSGVVWLAFEQDGAYYPLDTTEIGVVFEATALLVNCLKTIPETSSTVVPGGFTLSSANHVMTVNNGSIAVDELPNWDVYRRSLGGVKTIRITALNKNSAIQGVASLAYELGGKLYPIDTPEIGTTVQAEALLLNCLKSPSVSSKTVSPSNFTVSNANHVMEINNGSVLVTALSNWDIYRYDLGGQKSVRIDTLNKNSAIAGVAPLAFEQNGVYYPLDTDKTGIVFDATALLINCLKTPGTTVRTLSTGSFTLYQANHVLNGNNGYILVEELPNWDIYRYSLGGRKTIRIDTLTENSAIQGVPALAYELDGQYYWISQNEVGVVFEADALLINCMKTQTYSQVTLTPSDFSLDWQNRYFGWDASANKYAMISNTSWDSYLATVASSWTDIRFDSITLNPNITGVYAACCWDGYGYQPITPETIANKTVYNIKQVRLNYFKGNGEFAATELKYTPNPNAITRTYSISSVKFTTFDAGNPTRTYSITNTTFSTLDSSNPTRTYSITSASFATLDVDNPTRSYPLASVKYTTDPNSGRLVTERSFSLDHADYVLDPNDSGVAHYATLSDLANAINNRVLTGAMTVNLASDVYSETWLGGMSGTGNVTINGGGHALIGNMSVYNQNVPMSFNNLTVKGSMGFNSCKYVSFSQCTLNGNGNPVALFLGQGTVCHLMKTLLYNAGILINAYSGSTLVASDTGGAQAGKACLVADTSTILMHGTRPEGDIQLSTCLSMPANPSELTPYAGESGSPSVTPTKLLTPITAHASSTYYGGSWYSASDVNIRQGVMSMKGGDKVLSGCMWFDISSASGKTIRSATLTLTRLAGYGVSGDVDVILWCTKVTGRSGRATSGAVSYGSIGAIGNGETKAFSVPVEAVTALVNGTMGGLMLQSTDTVTKAGKGYSRNYAMFAGAGTENAPKLAITFQ